jgi:hypothetical protein
LGRVVPRLFEIYAASDQTSPENWFQRFQLSNVWRGLVSVDDDLQPLEGGLQALDAESWAVFRVKAARLVHLMDKWGYSRQLFDCFNELEGYRYLVQEGYQEVRFIPEQQSARTPDLRAQSATEAVLMEVKTVNESDNQKDDFEIPRERRDALRVETPSVAGT